MLGFRSLLVPLDFTPVATRVLEAAMRVAQAGADVRLLHVVSWVPSVVEGTLVGTANPREVRALHESSRQALQRYAERCRDVNVVAEVVEGNVARAILEAAGKSSPDLIVIGRTLHRGLVGRHPGGVVEHVLVGARCPVLVVPA